MSHLGQFPTTRLRRLRQHTLIRDLVRETRLHVSDLVLPIFIRHGAGIKKPISSMPGHYQLSVDKLADEIKSISALGIKSILLFGIPAEKDALGLDAYADDGRSSEI